LGDYFQKNNDFIFAVGSFFYKGLGYRKSLESLLNDHILSEICLMRDTSEIWINYVTFCVACYQLPFIIWHNFQSDFKKN